MWAEWLGRKGGLRTESRAAEYHGAGAASGRWWRERDRDRERGETPETETPGTGTGSNMG